MNSLEKDYSKLYQLQDKFLDWWCILGFPFYLTGGTALGRFYLNHRYSEDLDFFVNADARYQDYISDLKKKIISRFTVNLQQSLFSDDFTRLFITDNNTNLKIEFINDIDSYIGNPLAYQYGWIDSPLNILSNKLTAIISRDEPKDIFDIIHLSLNYAFDWQEIFFHAKQKAVINEIDVAQRLISFPIEWLKSVNWLVAPLDLGLMSVILRQIADDFFLGKSNSYGKNKKPIGLAKPVFQ